MLFGPLSETISSVSWRDCALAGEKIAGAEAMLPASAAVDFRKSRRFMEVPRCSHQRAGILFRKGRASFARTRQLSLSG